MTEQETNPLTQEIATELGETEASAVRKIALLLKIMGEDFVESLLAETLGAEAKGGLMTNDGCQAFSSRPPKKDNNS